LRENLVNAFVTEAMKGSLRGLVGPAQFQKDEKAGDDVNNEEKDCGAASTSINSAAGNDQELFASAECIWNAGQNYERVIIKAHFRSYFGIGKRTQMSALLMPVTAIKP
jgi:hypothetical protein